MTTEASTSDNIEPGLHSSPGPMDGLLDVARMRVVQLCALTAILGAFTYIAFSLKYSVIDPDLYWHMSVGDWIVRNGTVPHTGILSRTAADLPWIAYSWGSEVLVSRAYAWFGLLGLGGYGSALIFMVALVLLWSLQRLSRNFWLSLFLWSASCLAALYSLMPRPVFFSMALYIMTLTLILEAERSNDMRRLWWLVPLFWVWANLHIQFIYGLFLIGLMLVPPVMQALARLFPAVRKWLDLHVEISPLPLSKVSILLALCAIVTCIGPYTYHLYGVIASYSRATLTYSTIQELQPVSYTYKEQYIPLFITAAAFFALGMRRRIACYQLFLLVIATVVAARTVRDTWFICFTAVIIIAEAVGSREKRTAETRPSRQQWLEWAGVGAAWMALIPLIAMNTDFNTVGLNRAISANYPVKACNYLRSTLPTGPMYNNLTWGGFLTWYLPMYPVASDGRNDLYNGPIGDTLLRTETEFGSYKQNPYLKESNFILVGAKEPLAISLSVNPNYQLLYSDEQAQIYVPAAGETQH